MATLGFPWEPGKCCSFGHVTAPNNIRIPLIGNKENDTNVWLWLKMCLPHLRLGSRGQRACVFTPTVASPESSRGPGTRWMLCKYHINMIEWTKWLVKSSPLKLLGFRQAQVPGPRTPVKPKFRGLSPPPHFYGIPVFSVCYLDNL